MVVGVFVGHDQEAPDSAGDRVFGHRGISELTELLQAGLVVFQPQPSRGLLFGEALFRLPIRCL